MHYSTVLISNNYTLNSIFNLQIMEEDFLNNYELIDENSFIIKSNKNNVIYFDYLIIDSIKLFDYFFKNILKNDDNLPITNYYHQTSIDNIFSIGISSSSSKSIESQITDIIEFLNE